MRDAQPEGSGQLPQPQPVTQTTFAVYSGPSLDSIRSIVASEFQVKDTFLDPYGVPTVLVSAEPAKQKFKNILRQLTDHSLIAAMRGAGDTLTIKIFQKPQIGPSRRSINLITFLVTVATVTLSGYILATGIFTSIEPLFSELNQILSPGVPGYLQAVLFSAGLLSIIGLHEFGHKAATVHHKLDATLPYFIPGPPPIGTFGAVIALRAPPANRDQLFDLGLSGPVVGFIVTICVGALSIYFGTPYGPIAQQLADWNSKCIAQLGSAAACGGANAGFPKTPLILIWLYQLISPAPGGVIVQQQLYFAAQIGALLTFLNLIPAWQLDGGHISRAMLGPYGHRIATLAGLFVLLVTGYWFGYWGFALFIIVMIAISRRGITGVQPLDDVSSVSHSRKLLYLLGLIMLVVTFASVPI